MKQQAQILQYPAIFNPAEEGGYVVTFPDFPGCVTEGDTLAKAKKYAAEVLELWIEVLKEDGQPLPPSSQKPLIKEIKVQAPAYT